MIRKKVPEGIDRPAATIHDDATLATYNNLPVTEWAAGFYTWAVYAEGGAGAPRYGQYTYPQGGGKSGGRILAQSGWIMEKPTDAAIGTGTRVWGSSPASGGIFAGRFSIGGVDGDRAIAILDPSPQQLYSIPIYDGAGSVVATEFVSSGGKGWETVSPQTSGQQGAIQRTLLAGVL